MPIHKEHYEDHFFNDEDEDNYTDQPDEPEMKSAYQIFVGDNFHPRDEEEVDDGGAYPTQEDAITAAKMIVDKSLRWERQNIRDKYDPDELYNQYTDFGDSPMICPETDPPLSALDYARVRCAEICREPF